MRQLILFLFLVGCGIFSEKAVSSVPIVFSGSSNQTNSPVQLTLNQPVEFVMTANMLSGGFLLFTIQNAQAIDQLTQSAVSGGSFSSSISYSINGTGSYQNYFNWNDGGYNGADITRRDSSLMMQLGQNISIGDKITFSAGTLGGIPSGMDFDVPSSGNYTTFLVNGSGGTRVSGFGVAVPEPSALSLLAVGLGGLAIMRCKQPKRSNKI